MSLFPCVVADTPLVLPEPVYVLGQALISLVGGLLLVAAGIRLLVLFRQVPSANWRRWVAYIPFVVSVPEFILAIVAAITYHNVARRWLRLDPTTGKKWTVPVDEIGADGVSNAAVMVQSGTAERPGLMLGAAMASLR